MQAHGVAHRRQPAQKLLRYAGPPNTDYAEMFMTMDVPRSAKLGSHVIELYGPRPGGAAGQLCGDLPERQARLATTTASIESQRR